MKVSKKITLAIVAASLSCVIIVAAILATRTMSLSSQSLTAKVSDQLTAITQAKKSEINNYFQLIGNQIKTLANSTMTEDALAQFSYAFQSINDEISTSPQKEAALKRYYTEQFSNQYQNINDERTSALDKYNQLTETAKRLQQSYISENTHPLGSKDALANANDGSVYSEIHAVFHPNFQHYLKTFGYYDIFLIDNQGNIVYSVYKELDYATNLLNGPYASSGIAQAYKQVRQAPKGELGFVDFAAYYPSYDSPASFIASPVYKNDKQIGALIFQMPIERISQIISNNDKWAESGMGKTGELFLVGPDKRLRSEPRLLNDDKDAYLSRLQAMGINEATIHKIDYQNSAAGQQPIDSEAASKALTGQQGLMTQMGYRGNEVIAIYSPLEVYGITWAVVSQQDTSEALSATAQISDDILYSTLLTALGLAVVASIAAFYLGRSIGAPILALADKIQHIAANKDLTIQLELKGKNELSQLSDSLNGMFASFRDVIQQTHNASSLLLQSSKDISTDIVDMRGQIDEQARNSSQVATAATQMAASISEVSEHASNASEASDNITLSAQEGSQIGDNLVARMQQLQNDMSNATQSMEQLSQESESIGSVLDVIQEIAEQTNLLALNAAIEAARAGEQGRGFAVVADEVRSLATRTQDSTEEIRKKVEALQLETRKVMSGIEQANAAVLESVENCTENNSKLSQITEMIERINEMNMQIATAANQQTQVTDEISQNVNTMAQSADRVSERTRNTEQTVTQLSEQATTLENTISHFKT
ncbi:methyl-accepting chemotaxis protein [Salinivibrio sp. DV]|uniref:methyl-accepting chemotaxis protein n=1 Tax=Salinivibrio sp. SS2 TaxID=1892894 RepID=UPI00084C3E30|nr:methyl-accepting chemotaxis protein [Salinivibrio sp. DV]ODQ01225.1 hypothetical protein BGK46_03465 [Salinivibrio sp. DV]